MLTRPKLMLPFQIARAIQTEFVWRAGTARPAFVMSSEVETSLFLTRPWQRGHSLRSLDSLGMTDGAVVVVTRPARARGARYRAIQKGGSMSLRSDCSDTMRPL